MEEEDLDLGQWIEVKYGSNYGDYLTGLTQASRSLKPARRRDQKPQGAPMRIRLLFLGFIIMASSSVMTILL